VAVNQNKSVQLHVEEMEDRVVPSTLLSGTFFNGTWSYDTATHQATINGSATQANQIHLTANTTTGHLVVDNYHIKTETAIPLSAQTRIAVNLGAGNDDFYNFLNAVQDPVSPPQFGLLVVHGGAGDDQLVNYSRRGTVIMYGDAGNDRI